MDGGQVGLLSGGDGGSLLLVEETKRQLRLAAPLAAAGLVQYCVQVVSLMFAGHLGQLPLAGASLATSFANVTGFSVLLGMSTALDTFCGQAYGAKAYAILGVHLQRSMVVITAASFPLAVLWFFSGWILATVGQNADIAREAGSYARRLIPGLFAFGLLQCHFRFLQTQNRVVPMLLCSGFAALCHVPLCWLLVRRIGLGNAGAAMATSASYWITAALCAGYVNFSPACKHTWTGLSVEALRDVGKFLRLAVPSAFMICLEYWAFEVVVLAAGFLPDPKLETSVLSVSLNTMWMVYVIPTAISSAVSIRVSNELGAGNAAAARLAFLAAGLISLTEGLAIAIITIAVRDVWGYVYSNDGEVVAHVSRIMPLLAVSDFLDGVQCTLSGAARGCGWQDACSIINLMSYYIIGVPCSLGFAFLLRIGGPGLWWGIICAMAVQISALVAVVLRTDWDSEAKKAMDRILEVEEEEHDASIG